MILVRARLLRRDPDTLSDAGPGPATLEVLRRGERLRLTLDLPDEPGPVGYGLSAAAPKAIVAVYDPETAAAKAGLRTGDRITRVGERDILDWPELVEVLRGAEGSLELEAARARILGECAGDFLDGLDRKIDRLAEVLPGD